MQLEELTKKLKSIEAEGSQMVNSLPQMAKLAAPQMYLRANALVADITALRIQLERELKGVNHAT